MQKVKINGKTYIAVSDHYNNGMYKGCRQCAFFDTLECDEVNTEHNNCKDIIWQELSSTDKEERYTVEEFIEVLEAWIADPDGGDRNEYIKNHLKNMADPEYKEYLRLKEKFEK